MVVTEVGLVYKECCNSYMGTLRTINVLWWLHGFADDHKDGICGCWVGGLGHTCITMASRADWRPPGCFRCYYIWIR